MARSALLLTLSIAALSIGCATSQNVRLAQQTGGQPVTTFALVPSEGNSAAMDTAIAAAFAGQGLTSKAALPAGTSSSADVDAIVSYTDQWRWDIVMYLRSVTISMYDGRSGNLIADARWDNSAFHGFQDYKVVVRGLVDEMVAKVKARSR